MARNGTNSQSQGRIMGKILDYLLNFGSKSHEVYAITYNQEGKETRTIQKKSRLYAAAQQLIDAANQYRQTYLEQAGGGQILWITTTDNSLIILTKGEYRQALLDNIIAIQKQEDLTTFNVEGTP